MSHLNLESFRCGDDCGHVTHASVPYANIVCNTTWWFVFLFRLGWSVELRTHSLTRTMSAASSSNGKPGYLDHLEFRFKYPNDIQRFAFSFKDLEKREQALAKKRSDALSGRRPDEPVVGRIVRVLSSEKLGAVQGRCATCRHFVDECPGHFAHMFLEAPVMHPLLKSLLVKLLKASCYHCHHFLAHEQLVQAYAKQAELICRGLFREASQITPMIVSLQSTLSQKSNQKVSSNEDVVVADDNDDGVSSPKFWNKHITAIYNKARRGHAEPTKPDVNGLDFTLQEDLIKGLLASVVNPGGEKEKQKRGSGRFCMRCRQECAQLSTRNMQIYLRGQQAHRVWRIDQIRDHLRQLWANERELLEWMLPTLSTRLQMAPKDAWEAFFVTHLSIMPPRFRKSSEMADRVSLHAHTKALNAIQHLNEELEVIKRQGVTWGDQQYDRLVYSMQMFVCSIFDSSLMPEYLVLCPCALMPIYPPVPVPLAPAPSFPYCPPL